ncbi:MAG: succinate dehydrogenase [Phycisphaerales bacterium]|nr:MAG: succinate dehydrogenase [Phycisphaerales bacterium]
MAEAIADLGDRSDPYHFLVRRLHSLTGIVPVGVFLCIHLSINASILAGPNAFQFAVNQIHNLSRLGILQVVEVLFIILPILYHAVVGVLIYLSGKPNLVNYQYGGNVRYVLQRWTGIITIFFILTHLWHVHWIIPGGAEFNADDAAASVVQAMAAGWTAPIYAIGVLCAVFHFANGIWTFLISWGITVGPRSQMLSGRVCIIIGLILGLLGVAALIRIKTMDLATMPQGADEAQAAHVAGGTEVH